MPRIDYATRPRWRREPCPPLPDDAAALTRDLAAAARGGWHTPGPLPDRRRLAGWITLLSEAGWRYESIGRALGVQRSRIHQLTHGLHPDRTDLPPAPPAPQPPPPLATIRRPPHPPPADVTPDEARRLHGLAALARQARGPHPPDHPARLAARDLDAALHDHRQRGVPTATLAAAIGITETGVRHRLMRHRATAAPALPTAPDARAGG